MLGLDIGNNSVWSYRYFLLNKSPENVTKAQEVGLTEFVREEVNLVLQKWLPRRLDNEACWVYLRGMLASSEDEAEKSLAKNVKRVYIGNFKDVL